MAIVVVEVTRMLLPEAVVDMVQAATVCNIKMVLWL